MAEVRLEHIRKAYGDNVIVKDFDLTIRDKEFMVFVGPSGCGKSTTLRMIAGLEDITSGKLYIGDKLMNDVSPKDRDIAMVFQNYALYPHMTVYENMAFGLKMRHVPKDVIKRKVQEAAASLQLTELLDRKPKALSGGQRQRVAMGRAVVREPSVFLMDEPLSNLDAKLRGTMRTEISRLHQRLQTTMIYVTHDQTEAMTLGDRIVVLNDGVIQQVDTPMNLYRHPCNKFVAGFIGSPSMNFLPARIVGEEGEVYLEGDGFHANVSYDMAQKLVDVGAREVLLGVRPDDIHDAGLLLAEKKEIAGQGTVEIVEQLGATTLLHMRLGTQQIVASMPGGQEYAVGQQVPLVFNIDNLHVFSTHDERNLML